MDSAPPSSDEALPADVNVEASAAAEPSLRIRAAAAISSVFAVVLGIAPHVLHHAGPIAGAALLAGTGGTLIFGLVGLIASVPFLLRIHRRSGGWSVPAGLFVLFVAGFALSSFVIGPAISGRDQSSTNDSKPATPAEHDGHHE